MKKVNYFFFSLIFAATLLNGQAVFAAEGEGDFSLTPFYKEIVLEKDQPFSDFLLEVENKSALPAVIRLSVLDFGTLDESGGVAFLGSSENSKYALASWISLEKDAVAIDPRSSQAIKVTVQNKESLSPGGHYGAVVFKAENIRGDSTTSSSQVVFDQSMASLLFVRKVGGEVYGLHLDSQEAGKNIFKLPASANLRFQNTGNVHVTPRGSLEIADPLGRVVSKSIINEQSSIILPESFRVLPAKFTALRLAFVPGRYTLKTSYRYEGLDIFSNSTQAFWFVPPLFYAVLILICLTIFSGFKYWRKKKKVL